MPTSAALAAYRDWLLGELKLLGNASHHAYSFGQANMAKRAIEQLDAALAGDPSLAVNRELAGRAVASLNELTATAPLPPALAELRAVLDAGRVAEPTA
ncbi:MAG: hypothetical protein ACREM6_03235 [Vulcanimicrobiaceae bacterium]